MLVLRLNLIYMHQAPYYIALGPSFDRRNAIAVPDLHLLENLGMLTHSVPFIWDAFFAKCILGLKNHDFSSTSKYFCSLIYHIYRVLFFYCSAQKTTKYKEKLKYQNCSANCSQKILSTRKKTKYQNREYGTCVFVHFYLACQSTFSSVMNAVHYFSGQ